MFESGQLVNPELYFKGFDDEEGDTPADAPAGVPAVPYVPSDAPIAPKEVEARTIGANLANKSTAAQARADVRYTQAKFEAADRDFSGSLSFGEFCDMLPEKMRGMHRPEEMKAWFDAIDSSHDGSIDTTEFFVFTLRHTTKAVGTRLDDVF